MPCCRRFKDRASSALCKRVQGRATKAGRCREVAKDVAAEDTWSPAASKATPATTTRHSFIAARCTVSCALCTVRFALCVRC